MFHIIVNRRGCCDYCGLPKQFFDLYPHCASKVKESQNTSTTGNPKLQVCCDDDEMTAASRMELEIKQPKIIVYQTVEEILSKFFDCPIEQVNEFNIGGDDYEISIHEFKKSLEIQKIWGFSQEDIIHIWLLNDIDIKQLIHFFVHEITHINVIEDESDPEIVAEKVALICDLSQDLALGLKKVECTYES